MNCKPGDLAQFVRAADVEEQPFIGSLVRCIEFMGARRGFSPECPNAVGRDMWRVEPLSPRLAALAAQYPGDHMLISDASLRPLPGDLPDETEQAELPKAVTA